jgi:hypothetical protein
MTRTALAIAVSILAVAGQAEGRALKPSLGADWEVSGTARFPDSRGAFPKFNETFPSVALHNVEIAPTVKDGKNVLRVRITGIEPNYALGIPGTPDRASLWADVTDGSHPARVKIREFAQGSSCNHVLPEDSDSEEMPYPNPIALRLVFHGGEVPGGCAEK